MVRSRWAATYAAIAVLLLASGAAHAEVRVRAEGPSFAFEGEEVELAIIEAFSEDCPDCALTKEWTDGSGEVLGTGDTFRLTESCPTTRSVVAVVEDELGAGTRRGISVEFRARAPSVERVDLQPRRHVVAGQAVTASIEFTDPCDEPSFREDTPMVVDVRFGDGTTRDGETPTREAEGRWSHEVTHSYADPGTYTIRFVVHDGTTRATVEASVVVVPESGEEFDSDEDGMTDEIERFYGLNPFDPRDADEDPDADGITNLSEVTAGTHPFVSNAPDVPRLTDPVDGFIVSGWPQTFSAQSEDPDGDEVTMEFAFFEDAELTEPVLGLESVGTGEITLDGDLPDRAAYWWRTRATDGLGFSRWSPARRFAVDTDNAAPSVPVPLGPVGVTEEREPSLVWIESFDPLGEAITYDVESFTDEALTSTFASATGLEEPGDYPFDTPFADGTSYWWRVRAVDERGAASEWSPAVFLRVNQENQAPTRPDILAPLGEDRISGADLRVSVANGTDPDGDPLFVVLEWAVDGAFDESCDPIVDATSPGGVDCARVSASDGNTTATFVSLATSGDYVLRAFMSDGTRRSDAAEVSFTARVDNATPSVPVLVSPIDDETATSLRPTLRTEASDDPDEEDEIFYDFEIYADPGLATPVARMPAVEAAGSEASVQPPNALADDLAYFWRARAVDEWGAASDWSAPARFFVVQANETPTAPQALRPADGATIAEGLSVVLEVQNAADPDGEPLSYRFDVYRDAELTQTVESRDRVSAGERVTRYTVQALLSPGTYHWTARARDAKAPGPPTEARSFTIYRLPAPDEIDTGGGDSGGCGTVRSAAPVAPFGLLVAIFLVALRRSQRECSR